MRWARFESVLRGVVFDLDDTLTDYTGLEAEVWQDVAELIGARIEGIDPARLRERYSANLEPMYLRVLSGELDIETFIRLRLVDALEPWGAVPDEDLLTEYMAIKQRLHTDVRPAVGAASALAAVRGAGLRVGVLTNGLVEIQHDKLEMIGFADAVDVIVTSEEAGAPKPDGRAFAAVSSALGVPAGSLAMVGDSVVNDIGGALDAGFAAAVLVGSRYPESLPEGALHVSEVADAPGTLGVA